MNVCMYVQSVCVCVYVCIHIQAYASYGLLALKAGQFWYVTML